MEQKIVTLQIKDEFISGAGVSIGAVGSHDDVLLEMDFRKSAAWDGTTKRAIFSNALGKTITPVLLTTNLLEEGQSDVYLVPVPGEAKDVAGECFLTVEGFFINDGVETVRIVTEEVNFRVLPSKLYTGTFIISPSAAEQLQAEIEQIKTGQAEAEKAVEQARSEADRAQAEAERASVPAVDGVYNIIIVDRITGDKYALIVENGVLEILGVSNTLKATELNLIDSVTGVAYELLVESGKITLQEV